MQPDEKEIAAEISQSSARLDEARHILEGFLDISVIEPSDDEFDDTLESEIGGNSEGGGIALLALDRMLNEVVTIIVEEVDNLRSLSERIESHTYDI